MTVVMKMNSLAAKNIYQCVLELLKMHKTVENILSKLNILIFWARLYIKRATLKYGALYIL